MREKRQLLASEHPLSSQLRDSLTNVAYERRRIIKKPANTTMTIIAVIVIQFSSMGIHLRCRSRKERLAYTPETVNIQEHSCNFE